jgi:hypothetical protein
MIRMMGEVWLGKYGNGNGRGLISIRNLGGGKQYHRRLHSGELVGPGCNLGPPNTKQEY